MWKKAGWGFKLVGTSRSETSAEVISSSEGAAQAQSVATNSTALQAGGNITINQGLALKDVQHALSFFLEQNLPRLEEVARAAAEKNVGEFAKTLTGEMQASAAKVLVDKFTDPDVQAAMVDAVKGCARRGDLASPDILAKLVANRMGDNTPFLDLVLSEAIAVVPKLTRDQIAFVCYVFFVRSLSLQRPSFPAYEGLAVAAQPHLAAGLGLSRSQKQHLQYCGVLGFNEMMTGDMYEHLYNTAREGWGVKSVEEFKVALHQQAPTYAALQAVFSDNGVFQCDLTSVGFAIAITVLKPFLGLELSTWLK